MPATDWKKRAVFAKEYAVSGNGTQAAVVAGVPAASAHAVAYKWLRNTDILALIREEIDCRLRDLGPVAVDVMRQIMLDPNVPANTRLTAARDMLDRLGWVPPRRSDAASITTATPLEEMPTCELMAIIQNAKKDNIFAAELTDN